MVFFCSDAVSADPRAILFDLFGTLVFFDDSRLPRMEVSGRSVIMTVRSLPDLLRQACPATSVTAFLTALQEIGAELAEVKRRTCVEILTHVRFERALLCQGADPGVAARVARAMALEHMHSLAGAVVCPNDRVQVLRRLAGRFRLGLLSNFDDGPTARGILDEYDLAPHFDTIVISADAGLRKPSRELFEQACRQMSMEPADCLYVGDTWREDIEGATSAGLSAVWITSQDVAEPPALGRIADVGELAGWVEERWPSAQGAARS